MFMRPCCLGLIVVVTSLLGVDPLLAHGDLDEAIEGVSQAIVSHPDDASLYLRRAELFRLHAEWTSAEADYRKALTLTPDMHVVVFGLAQLRVAQGKPDRAQELLNQFLEKVPKHAEARMLRAHLLEENGKWEDADADLAVAVASSPEPHYATARARLLASHGRRDLAILVLDQASADRGGAPILEHQALEFEISGNDLTAALRRLDGLIAREPRPDLWLARKAQILAEHGRRAEASATWLRAAEVFSCVPPEKRLLPVNQDLSARIQEGLASSRTATSRTDE